MSAIGKRLQRPRAEPPMDVLELPQIGRVVVPLERLAHAFGRVVRAGQDVLDAVLCREVVQAGEEGVVLRRVQVRDLRLEERELEVLHLAPVYDLGVEVHAEPVHQFLDVVDRLLGVPARVHVKEQRPQPELLLRQVRDVGAVHAAADADQAVVVPPLSFPPDPLHDRRDDPLPDLVGVPVRKDVLVIVVAVVAPATRVERDVRVARVHDAVRADLIRALRGVTVRHRCYSRKRQWTIRGGHTPPSEPGGRAAHLLNKAEIKLTLPARGVLST